MFFPLCPLLLPPFPPRFHLLLPPFLDDYDPVVVIVVIVVVVVINTIFPTTFS